MSSFLVSFLGQEPESSILLTEYDTQNLDVGIVLNPFHLFLRLKLLMNLNLTNTLHCSTMIMTYRRREEDVPRDSNSVTSLKGYFRLDRNSIRGFRRSVCTV